MKITIITIVFNRANVIRRAVESVLSQTYNDIEYIVIDGASTDGTCEILSEYRELLSTFISEKDSGLYEAINKGIGLATGDVIGFLHSDDVFNDNLVLERVAKTFSVCHASTAVVGDVAIVGRDDKKILRYYSGRWPSKVELILGLQPPHTGMFLSKDLYDSVGLYRQDIPISADFEFFLRLTKVGGFKKVHLKSLIVRQSVGGLSSDGLKSFLAVTADIQRSLSIYGYKVPRFLLVIRLPIKLFIQSFYYRVIRRK